MLRTSTLILVAFVGAIAQAATPGEPDTTFGTGGRTVIADNSQANGLRLPDGSILVASQMPSTTMTLRRFDSEGHVDATFGIAGVVNHEFAAMTDVTQAVARGPDGRVYFGGWTVTPRDDSNYFDLAILATDTEGAAVADFGNHGLASYDLSNPLNSGFTDTAGSLAVMPDGRLLAAGYSSDHYYEWDDPYDRLTQLLRFNADGSLERQIDAGEVTPVCSGIAGLEMRADGSVLLGDDSGIRALLDDTVLPTFGVGGTAADENWHYHATVCDGLRGFASDESGELLAVSAVSSSDQLQGFVLARLQQDGTKVEPSEPRVPVPFASLVAASAQFADTHVSELGILTSRPVKSPTDDRVYVQFSFGWSDDQDHSGTGWAIARFAEDGTFDTGWGEGGLVVLQKRQGDFTHVPPTLLEILPDGRVLAMTGDGVLTRLSGGRRDGHGALNIQSSGDAGEDAGHISLEVTRIGGSAGAVSVEYSTGEAGPGEATPNEDFSAASGRLDWADGDTTVREIVIPILQDELREDSEQFAVEMSAVSGGAVLFNTKALLTIDDDNDPALQPPPAGETETSGGGASDTLTLILLLSLTVLSAVKGRPDSREITFSS